jgi:phosphoglycolate phosphatase-like HAD superfamily hydrolase
MDKVLIKAVLCDFDQTLFDTREAKPYWKCGKPDWTTAYSKIPECPLFDGWRYTLAALHRLPFGIVSHNTKQFIDRVLRYYKVQEFSPVIGRYGEGSRPFRRALPKTTLFEQALQHEGFYGLEPNEILYLGDGARDVEQANEVGFLSGACYWGSQERELLDAASPTFRLHAPLDLLELCTQ